MAFGRGGGGFGGGRLIIAAIIAIFSLVSYFGSKQVNPVTGEKQHVNLTDKEEIALGLQAAPQMAQQHGGLHRDDNAQEMIDRVGQTLVQGSDAKKSTYQFDFHLLADENTINAFALPGGQVFMTYGLMKKLTSEGQIAGVLGHEIGHVVGRHGAEHLAKQKLTQGLTGAAVLATYNPERGGMRNAAVAMAIGSLVNLKYGRDDELESDRLGVKYMVQSGYNPTSMLRVMEVLRDAAKGPRQPEFMSSHPDPGNRLQKIEDAIKAEFPQGLPSGLKD